MISFSGKGGRETSSRIAANPSAEANVRARSRQKLLALAAIGALAIGGSWYVLKGDGKREETEVEGVLQAVRISDTVNRNLSQKEWLASSEADIAQMKNKLKEIERGQSLGSEVEERLAALEKENAELKRDGQRVLAAYEQENARLKKQVERAAATQPAGQGPADPWKGEEPFRPASGKTGAGRQGGGNRTFPSGFGEVKTISFAATSGKGGPGSPRGFNAMTPDAPPTTIEASEDYLPPNSYAPARVIVGVDASAGVHSQTDPLPVLLRITGPARSVINNGKLLTTKLEGCVINGAARGDLSSEKVYVKLVRMTCDQPGGRVAVSEVKGYISFGGKAGVRGNVVSREGGLVMQALLAGIAGGFGRGFQANANSMLRNPTVTIDGERPQLSTGDIVRGGLGEGASTAGDMVSKYLIERAEQYQPVVEMPTGVDVEIVFLDGVYVRGSKS